MQQLAVPRRLERFVRAMRVVDVPAAAADLAPEHYHRLPDGETELMVRLEAHGYFDQAHLIAEFREMAGATPGVLVG